MPLSQGSITIEIPLSSSRSEGNKSYATYLVNVQCGDVHWSIAHRFSRFLQLHQGVRVISVLTLNWTQLKLLQLQDKFPKTKFPTFPQRCLWHTRNDVELRRVALEKYLQEITNNEEILNSWDLDYFLQIMNHTGVKNNLKVLIPLPLKDFDPTEGKI